MKKIRSLIIAGALAIGATGAAIATDTNPVQAQSCISYYHGNGGIARCDGQIPVGSTKTRVAISCVYPTTFGYGVSYQYGPWVNNTHNSYRACSVGYVSTVGLQRN